MNIEERFEIKRTKRLGTLRDNIEANYSAVPRHWKLLVPKFELVIVDTKLYMVPELDFHYKTKINPALDRTRVFLLVNDEPEHPAVLKSKNENHDKIFVSSHRLNAVEMQVVIEEFLHEIARLIYNNAPALVAALKHRTAGTTLEKRYPVAKTSALFRHLFVQFIMDPIHLRRSDLEGYALIAAVDEEARRGTYSRKIA